MSQTKVFEFAKELGMQTLELMDKLREWKIPVKSHMAELDSDMLETIRSKLKPSADGAKKAAKKKKPAEEEAVKASAKTAGKDTAAKAPLKAEASGKVSAGKTVSKSAAAKAPVKAPVKAIVSTAVKSTAKKKAAPVEVAPAPAEAGRKVIRRKAGSAEAAAAEAKAAEAEEAEVSSEERLEQSLREQAQQFTQNKHHEKVDEAAHHEAQAAKIPSAKAEAPVEHAEVAEPAQLEATHAPRVEVPEILAAPAEAAPAAAAVVVDSAVTASAVAQIPVVAEVRANTAPVVGGPGAGPADGRPRPPMKREVVVGNSQIQSDLPRVARPRGNIVGRMDLSRATPPPGSPQAGGPGFSRPGGPSSGGPGMSSRPGGPSTGAGAAAGFRGGAGPRPGGNIRPGFFQAPPTELPALGRPEDRRRPVRPRVAGAPGTGPVEEGAAREEVVESFLSSEYRKREVVFQPKKKVNILTREAKKTQITTAKASKRVLEINKTIILKDLAEQMKMKAGPVVSMLMKNGMMVNLNSELDFDTVTLVAAEFGFELVNTYRSADDLLAEAKTLATPVGSVQITRSPIVTVMGHVDHGKTSLLDAIRKTDTAAGEAGGITQHIGAYQVKLEDGHTVTFIDTPGHAAFTAMRARGANTTDIAVIVVAGDDGAMPQTVEAINHAKSAGVPIIVAINKMDKPGINPERIKQQLTEYELVPEEWGGTTIFVPVSATKRTGIKELLEQIHLLAEIQELKASMDVPASGVVIEARIEKGRGVVATVLVRDGVLKVGQPIVAGKSFGKVRAMLDDKRKVMKEAGPSVPVEILGLNETPNAGDRFDVCADETSARQISEARRELVKSAEKTPASKMTLEDLFGKVKMGDTKELILILKADVSGSAEAIKTQLEKLGTSEVKTRVIHTAIGNISESDVLLASTTKGVIIGFNVKTDAQTTSLAQQEGVEIKSYRIIYELLDDVKKAMGGLLAPEVTEKSLGKVEIRNVFTLPKAGTIAGGMVIDGKILRSAHVRVIRDGKSAFEGKIASLRRFKDDVREVLQGFECGVAIENFTEIKVGDVIEAFEKTSTARTID